MSHTKVKSIGIIKDTDGTYFIRGNVADSNVTDWNGNYCWNVEEWCKGRKTKEELEKEILFDYFYGNLQGGSNRFTDYINTCGKWNNRGTGKASQVYDKYDKLMALAYKMVVSIQESPKEWELYNKLRKRQHREVERVLYDDFKEFCKLDKSQTKTILILQEFEKSTGVTYDKGYIYVGKGQRTPRLIQQKEYATVYTDSLKMNKVINKLENMGYTVKQIEV